MSLTQPQRIQISGEQVDLPQKIQVMNDSATALNAQKTDLQSKDGSLKLFFDKQNVNCNAYQTEHRWLNGTTYTTVVEQDILNAAQRLANNHYFPSDGSWTKFQPRVHATDEGKTITSSGSHEKEMLEKNIQSNGVLELLNLFINGQSGYYSYLADNYTPGSNFIRLAVPYSIGTILILGDKSGSKPSALMRVTGVSFGFSPGNSVVEIVAPESGLSGGDPISFTLVNSTIQPFTTNEKNTLIYSNSQTDYPDGNYNNVLNGMATLIKTSILNWETPIDNQRVQIVANLDSRGTQAGELLAAKNDIDNAKSIINYWQALDDKYSDNNSLITKFINAELSKVYTEATDRQTYIGTTRSGQITTALGSITQVSAGTFTGTGLYLERFKQIDLRINLAGGPLTEFYEKDVGVQAVDQVINTSTTTASTYDTELRTEASTSDSTGTSVITVASTTGFSNGNTIFIMADSLVELTGTILTINGLNIVLSFTIPNTYTKALRTRIYKQL